MAGSALHPMIHLGFSIAFSDSNVPFAEGLAYMTHSFLPLLDYSLFESNSTPEDRQKDLKAIVVDIRNDDGLWNLMRNTKETGFQSKLKLLQDSVSLLGHLSKWNVLHSNTSSEEVAVADEKPVAVHDKQNALGEAINLPT